MDVFGQTDRILVFVIVPIIDGPTEPADRYRVLQRFYGLREPLIQRFYAGRLRTADKVRLMVGKPPVPIRRAIGCLADRD